MTNHEPETESLCWGTSDSAATVRARATATLELRFEWLSDALEFALATGALSRDRAQRQAEADRWAREWL